MPAKLSPEELAQRQAATAAAQARRDAWYDRVAVERVLRAWALDDRRPLADVVGRPLTKRERRVALHALRAVGETASGVARHLRANSTLLAELRPEPTGGAARAQHRRDVAAAVAYLRRYNAPELIATRRYPFSRAEADRMLAAAAGQGAVSRSALFDQAIA